MELYTSQKGTTVVGRSRTNKAKAIFVQLIDRDANCERASIRGTGYLVASDFCLDSREKKHELKLLAAAIRKDFAASIDEPLPAAPDPDVAAEPAEPAPTPVTPTPVPAPTAIPEPVVMPEPVVTPEPATRTPAVAPTIVAQPVKPCARSIIKSLIWGVDLLKDTLSVVSNGVQCLVSKDACGSAVASFTHGVALVEKFNERTYKSR